MVFGQLASYLRRLDNRQGGRPLGDRVHILTRQWHTERNLDREAHLRRGELVGSDDSDAFSDEDGREVDNPQTPRDE